MHLCRNRMDQYSKLKQNKTRKELPDSVIYHLEQVSQPPLALVPSFANVYNKSADVPHQIASH